MEANTSVMEANTSVIEANASVMDTNTSVMGADTSVMNTNTSFIEFQEGDFCDRAMLRCCETANWRMGVLSYAVSE